MKYIVQSKADPNKYWSITGNPRDSFEMGYNSDRSIAQAYDKDLAEDIARDNDGILIELSQVWFYT